MPVESGSRTYRVSTHETFSSSSPLPSHSLAHARRATVRGRYGVALDSCSHYIARAQASLALTHHDGNAKSSEVSEVAEVDQPVANCFVLKARQG